jgi:MFS family permease
MRLFSLIWSGQGISLIGSAMTVFGISTWVYLTTGSPTCFTTLILAGSLPGLLALPLAGALVDRWDRRSVMLLSDAGSAAAPLGVFLLHFAGVLQIWEVYALIAIGAVFKAFQWPAFSALVPQIVSRKDLAKANGRVSLIEAAGQVFGALLGGALYGLVGLGGLVLFDMLSFVLSIGTLLLSMRWWRAESPDGPAPQRQPLLAEILEGWHHIRQRPGLLGLLTFFAGNNLMMETAVVLVPPLVLSANDPAKLGVVNAIGSTGMVIVSLVISLTRGPRRRIRAVLTVAACQGLIVIFMGATHTVWTLAAGMFAILGGYAVSGAATSTLWQLKTPREVQGRVFAVRRMFAWSAEPIAYGLAGPIAQFVGTPLVSGHGALADTVGRLTGSGQGGGIAAVLLMAGPLLLCIVALTWLRPRVRHLETDLPDVPEQAEPATV